MVTDRADHLVRISPLYIARAINCELHTEASRLLYLNRATNRMGLSATARLPCLCWLCAV